MDWTGFPSGVHIAKARTGMDWKVMDWIGGERIGPSFIRPHGIGMDWNGMDRRGGEKIGWERTGLLSGIHNGKEWIGLQRSGVDRIGSACFANLGRISDE